MSIITKYGLDRLDERERWELYEELGASLHEGPYPPMTEEELREELGRRVAALDAPGAPPGRPWPEVEAEIRAKYKL